MLFDKSKNDILLETKQLTGPRLKVLRMFVLQKRQLWGHITIIKKTSTYSKKWTFSIAP